MDKPLLVSCGGAVVAGLLAFGLYQLGKSVPVYDVRTLAIVDLRTYARTYVVL